MIKLDWEGLNPLQVSAMKEIANIGLGHAARSLAEMTGQTFQISVPDVDSVPVEHIAALIGGPEEVAVGVFMPFEKDVDGYLAFLFPWASAKAVWSLLLGVTPEEPHEVTELEASAMIEIGNILNSHFLNSLAELTGLRMESTPPQVGIDAVYPILQSILVQAEMLDSVALTVETSLTNEDLGITGYFLFIPSKDGMATVLDKLGILEAA